MHGLGQMLWFEGERLFCFSYEAFPTFFPFGLISPWGCEDPRIQVRVWLEETAPGLLSVSGLAPRAQRTSGSPLAKRHGFHTMVPGHTQCPPGIHYGTSAGVVKLIEGTWSSKCCTPHSNARNSYLLPSRQNERTHINQRLSTTTAAAYSIFMYAHGIIPCYPNHGKHMKKVKFKSTQHSRH